ncbi:hypothetical protein ACWD4J_22790 [Streptomyces sp. NPDC002577]
MGQDGNQIPPHARLTEGFEEDAGRLVDVGRRERLIVDDAGTAVGFLLQAP